METLVFKDGTVLECKVLSRALLVIIVVDKEGRHYLVSKDAIESPKKFHVNENQV